MNQSFESPKPAATVILVKENEHGEPCFFLVKRHGRSGFIAGAHVFPGGRVDPEDAIAKMEQQTVPSFDAWAKTTESTPAVAFATAAIRETAEECGVFLVCEQSGAPIPTQLAASLFLQLKDGGSFHELIAQHSLQLRLQDCLPFTWWITPENEPKRYDTRFFLARIPDGQLASFDAHEVIGGDWFTAKDALAAYEDGAILLAPPTFAIMEDLRPFTSFNEIASQLSYPIKPICPVLTKDEMSEIVLALPGDRLHSQPADNCHSDRTRIIYTDAGRFASAFAPPD